MKHDRSKIYPHSGQPESSRSGPTATESDRGRQRLKRLLPLVIFVVFVVLIARDKVPAVNDWFEQIVNPEQWQAQQSCTQEALAAADSAGHARVLNHGQIHRTQAGFLVERMVIGHMADDGTEAQFQFSCYTNQSGEIVKKHKFLAGE